MVINIIYLIAVPFIDTNLQLASTAVTNGWYEVASLRFKIGQIDAHAEFYNQENNKVRIPFETIFFKYSDTNKWITTIWSDTDLRQQRLRLWLVNKKTYYDYEYEYIKFFLCNRIRLNFFKLGNRLLIVYFQEKDEFEEKTLWH